MTNGFQPSIKITYQKLNVLFTLLLLKTVPFFGFYATSVRYTKFAYLKSEILFCPYNTT